MSVVLAMEGVNRYAPTVLALSNVPVNLGTLWMMTLLPATVQK